MPYRIMLVDGSSFLFKSYHGYGHEKRRAPDGRDISVLYGTIQMIQNCAKILTPHHIVVVFDAPGGSYERKAIYPDYKAHRPERPEEIVRQEPLIRKFLKAGGTPVLSVVGVEADDVMATIAKVGSRKGFHVGIVSPDKDLVQTVKHLVSIFRPEKDDNGRRILTRVGEKETVERFGIPPSLIVDYLTLLGDTADNVPGVDKVGPKTAVEWLKKYGSLDGIIEHAVELPGLAGQNFRNSLDMLPMIKSLVSLRDDIDVPHWESPSEPDKYLLQEMQSEFGLPSWMGSLRDWCRGVS